MTRRSGSPTAAALCAVAAVVMVLGQVVPALDHLRALVWSSALVLLLVALVVVVARRRGTRP